MAQPGMRHCLIVMNDDGAGYVIACDRPGGQLARRGRPGAGWVCTSSTIISRRSPRRDLRGDRRLGRGELYGPGGYRPTFLPGQPEEAAGCGRRAWRWYRSCSRAARQRWRSQERLRPVGRGARPGGLRHRHRTPGRRAGVSSGLRGLGLLAHLREHGQLAAAGPATAAFSAKATPLAGSARTVRGRFPSARRSRSASGRSVRSKSSRRTPPGARASRRRAALPLVLLP